MCCRWFLRAALLLLPLCLQAQVEDELKASLDAYVGRWTGHFTIHSTATGYRETFPVEQNYWWKDDELCGIAVSSRDMGMESSRSRTRIQDDKLHSTIIRSTGEEKYIGILHEGGIVWLPEDLKRAADYQLKESIVEKDGQRLLKTEGFDSYVYQGGLGYIVYRGELAFQGE